jgi:hypothetical protein
MKKVISEEMHQHVNASRVPFGKLHPINKVHKRKGTQEWHKHTIYISQIIVDKSYRKLDN